LYPATSGEYSGGRGAHCDILLFGRTGLIMVNTKAKYSVHCLASLHTLHKMSQENSPHRLSEYGSILGYFVA
jgi:hypothetical protein